MGRRALRKDRNFGRVIYARRRACGVDKGFSGTREENFVTLIIAYKILRRNPWSLAFPVNQRSIVISVR